MSEPGTWQAPEAQAGPAPGVVFADPGARLIAYLVDAFINFVVIIVLAMLAFALVFIAPVLSILPILAVIVVPLVYFPYYWQRSGQTPGMRMTGIKVVRDSDGGPITWGPAILRLIGYWVNSIVFYIGFIWIFVDKRKRGWHDLIAGTVVIKAG